ncbi:hypothetical protein KUTG_02650 [Kutzneria sp. 744]|nr:hypothetical protein KUTG_02650 [Kutzneria sp. 744]
MNGLAESRARYEAELAPKLHGVPHAAARIGHGSEVLGFDTVFLPRVPRAGLGHSKPVPSLARFRPPRRLEWWGTPGGGDRNLPTTPGTGVASRLAGGRWIRRQATAD